jgi:hypothetical protein
MRCFGFADAECQGWREIKDREALYIAPPGTAITDPDRSKLIIDNMDQAYVTFNRKLTYLGSIITKDLDDGAEIKARIGKANGIIHSLNI